MTLPQIIETDTIFSRAGQRFYSWEIYHQGIPMIPRHIVQADSAGHACDFICRTKWIPRLQLTARPYESDDNNEEG